MGAVRGCSFFLRALIISALGLASGIGCRVITGDPPPPPSTILPGQSTGTFTTAHPSLGVALSHFLYLTPEPEQPIEFPHNTHVENGIACTDYCHESVTMGPRAGLPSVRTCMICHTAIATDRPRIQQITTMQEQGLDLAWQRVFGYPEEAHIRFNHAPHIRAKVECATCHGNIAEQTVAERNVELTMGTCVNCHAERNAPIDCLTCHF